MPASSRHYRQRKVFSFAANASLDRTYIGQEIDNAGATGAVTVTLPLDAQPGDLLFVDSPVAQAFTINPGSQGIFVLSGTAGTAGQSLHNNPTAGQTCELICTASGGTVGATAAGATWRVRNPTGSWAVS